MSNSAPIVRLRIQPDFCGITIVMWKKLFAPCLLLLLTFAIAAPASVSASSTSVAVDNTALMHDNSKGFDFLYGKWIVHNRRLEKRMAGSTTWTSFDARDEFSPLPGGLGTQEHYSTDFWKGFEAVGLHIYDPKMHLWTLYWVDNRNTPIALQPAIVGRFSDNVGTFEGADTFEGKPIIVRVTWKMVDRNNANWEQAFSMDSGKSWEVNWTMAFVRQQ